MPNQPIPDHKKASIVALSSKYGYRAISNELDVSKNTVKKYVDLADEDGMIEMQGKDLVVV